MRISMLIATCNFKLLKDCVDSILETTDLEVMDAEIIVSMNGCEPEAIDYIRNFKNNRIRYIWIDRRVGAITALNLAAQIADGEYFIKMDDDVKIFEWGDNNRWLNLLLNPFLEDEKVGQTGPLMERTFGGCHSFIGCLTMTTKKIWNELGGLDPIFNPGIGDDIDYSIRASKAGYKMVQTPEDGFYKEPGTRCTYPFVHLSVRDYVDDVDATKLDREHAATKLAREHAELLLERYGWPWGDEVRCSLLIKNIIKKNKVPDGCIQATDQFEGQVTNQSKNIRDLGPAG